MRLKVFNILIYISAAALMCAAFLGYFTFNYFYLYGHIQSLSDFVFCMIQWFKLAGLAVIAAAVFLKSKKFSVVLKYFYCFLPLLSLFWAKRYFGLSQFPVTDEEHIYYQINNFMPAAVIKITFFAESILMSLTAILVMLRDGFSFKSERKQLLSLLPVFAFTVPLNLFSGIVRGFSAKTYRLLLFRNFSVWHLASCLVLAGATVFTYYFLKNKDREKRYKYLSMLAIVLLVQFMSRASLLIGDGYNVYKTIFSFIPLFVCNMGVIVASIAVFTKKKILSDFSFFIHAPGALSVFVYFGKEGMSNFGTVLDFTFLYFVLTHALLFILCVVPVFLKEQRFSLKKCVVPLCYYAVFLLIAVMASEAISAMTFTYGDTSLAIESNFSFTQNCPIDINLPPLMVRIGNLSFDIFYLFVLFLAYEVIFFGSYTLYYIALGRRLNKKFVGSTSFEPADAITAVAALEGDLQQPA